MTTRGSLVECARCSGIFHRAERTCPGCGEPATSLAFCDEENPIDLDEEEEED